MVIFFDMDGTLAKTYDKPNYLESFYEQGFFRSLKPYALTSLANALIDKQFEVCILSACVESPYCHAEKIAWLQEHLPNLKATNLILCNCGENKAKVAKEWLYKHYTFPDRINALLIDDYSENIYAWEQEPYFYAYKFCNGMNNKSGNNYARKFKTNKQLWQHIVKFCENEGMV